MQRRSRGIHQGLLLLFFQIMQVGITNIPPVTLACIGLNIWLFLNPLKPSNWLCLSVESCYKGKDWQRLLLSPFHHADDWHLYFNMVSMLWKGLTLERRLGSIWFAYIIAVFSMLTGVVYLALEYTVAELLDQPAFKLYCAIGFSGVLFALKVLNNSYNPGGHTNVMGMYIPNKYACWVELVMIHLLSPNASFAGHLAGIIVGLMYTLGPLKRIMEACAGIFSFNTHYPRQQYYFNNTGYGGYQEDVFDRQPYQDVPRNYDIYTAGLTEEEQLERALRNSLRDRGIAVEEPTRLASCHKLVLTVVPHPMDSVFLQKMK
ncbi:rhomboid-related protein 4 isoform X1 [Phascolarctos cinereus]|uniref:Rhomboid-related protein 4 n=1 Tax=Phascolarctos cinereus TaxID=38626 RepID=A0A6P5JJ42_PHACI|nr:rhomboid-related protein 4 isoform X2 [Phascolarctos cinereus]